MSRGALVLTLALGALACARAPQAPPAARHLVLVTLDTLRADRLGCYGSRDVATPRMDALAAAGALAPEASVHVALTRPSHACLLTGRLPAEHGLRDNVSPPLDARVPTLAESLRGAGFHTAAFVSSIVLSSQSGLGRGFQTYGERFETGGDDDARFLNSIQKRGDVTTAEALAWLESQRDARLFLWLHLYDPHDPYEPPEPYASRYAGRPYDGEVAFTDELVGRLDDALARLGLRDATLLVVTSDHGEGLGEHGESVHGFFAYQSTLRVPFLARGPAIPPGSRIPVTVRGIDVMPTVLELLGVAAPAGLTGRSLAAALRGAPAPAEAATYAESLLPLLHYGWSDLRVLREGRWKYIQAPRPELYDLKHDPHEQRDLIHAEPARAAALREALARHLALEKQAAPAQGAGESVPPELLERLGALGYLGAGATQAGPSTGADPKDKIGEFKQLNRLVREGLLRLRAKDYAGSAERLGELLRRGIDSFEAHYYLARALGGLKRWSEAERHYRAAAAKLPGFGPAHLGTAECRLVAGDFAGALEVLQAGRKASPKDARLAEREAQVLRRLGRREAAAQAYAAAVALAPRDALLRVQQGEALRDIGRLDDAAAALREAVALDPAPASYWNALGMVLGAAGDLAGAEQAFREATARDAREAQYAYNLGLALVRQKRGDEAARWFRKALELRPGFKDARTRLAEIAKINATAR